MHRVTEKIAALSCLIGVAAAEFCPGAQAASAASLVRKGKKSFEQGRYTEASDQFRDAVQKDEESDIANFNLGTALYKQGDFESAVPHLKKALLSEKSDLKAKAHYNLGNTLYQQGMRREDKDVDGAIGSLEESLTQYDAALGQEEVDQDASFNRGFVEKELERLKKKREQQKQQQQNQQQQDSQKKDGQEKDQSSAQDESGSSSQKKSESENQEKGRRDHGAEDNASEKNAEKDAQQKQDQKKGDTKKQDGADSEQENLEKDDKGSSTKSSDVSDHENQVPLTPLSNQQISKEEAMKLLNAYQNTEEPKGLLNLFKGQMSDDGVSKDW